MKVQVIDFDEKYLQQALDVLHETTCLHTDCAPDYFININKQEAEPYLRWVIEDKNTFGLVALVKDNVAGLVVVHEEVHDGVIFRYKRFYEILDIVVAEKYRNAGVGKILHDEVVERAKENDIHRLELEVFDFNHNAMRFYKKLQYKEVSRVMVLDI